MFVNKSIHNIFQLVTRNLKKIQQEYVIECFTVEGKNCFIEFGQEKKMLRRFHMS